LYGGKPGRFRNSDGDHDASESEDNPLKKEKGADLILHQICTSKYGIINFLSD
jgi:hypothetical protein